MPRLFIGTFLSDQSCQKVLKLAEANAHLSKVWNTKVRWTAADKLHITWLFLGNVKGEVVAEVKAALAECMQGLKLSGEPLILQYEQLELWPNERKARLGVITPHVVPNDIPIIATGLEHALRRFIPKEERAHGHELKTFKPHLTVMRLSHDKKHRKSHSPYSEPVSSRSESVSSHSESQRTRIKFADVRVDRDIFPIAHKIDEIVLIESDLGKQTLGYEKLAAFKV